MAVCASDLISWTGCLVQAKRKEIDAAKKDIDSNTRQLKTTEGEIATATKSHRSLQLTTKVFKRNEEQFPVFKPSHIHFRGEP